MSKYQLNWFAQAAKDFKKLDNSQKIQVSRGLNKIATMGTQIGKPLIGNLIGLREIKLLRLGLRIVFAQNGNQIDVIDIIAVGKRADGEVFDVVEKRIK
ncbi:MAG: addiction module toxin RelE [Lactobacillaceae bacterium]|jgi:mRNA interferase RelE/StbE|nr:addiction module toxin RelE [Lactobacillaceae bacterium]